MCVRVWCGMTSSGMVRHGVVLCDMDNHRNGDKPSLKKNLAEKIW